MERVLTKKVLEKMQEYRDRVQSDDAAAIKKKEEEGGEDDDGIVKFVTKFTGTVKVRNDNVPLLLITQSFTVGTLVLLATTASNYFYPHLVLTFIIGVLSLLLFSTLLVAPVHRFNEKIVNWLSPSTIRAEVNAR
jgi:hypothetical protein